MTLKIKGNPIFSPELLNAMPNFPYYIQPEDRLGVKFLKSLIDIHIPHLDTRKSTENPFKI